MMFGHLVGWARRKIGAGDGRQIDHLSLHRARGKKGCGDRSISKLHRVLPFERRRMQATQPCSLPQSMTGG